MNKITTIAVAVFFGSIFLMNTVKVNAQMLGTDEENWNKVFTEFEKLNSRLIYLEKSTEEIKDALAQDRTGEVIEQINAQNKRLEDTNYFFRTELIPIIHEQITAGTLKTDLVKDRMGFANEKLSRLIEILKSMAQSEDKNQKGQQGIKEALADLRRKANVNISRSDDIKKALRQLGK
jgi:hypothetical protein